MMSRTLFLAVMAAALATLADPPLLAADERIVEYVLTVEGMN